MSDKKILVYIDQFQGAALPASWEAFTAAHTLAGKLPGEVVALVVGAGAKAVAEQAFHYGADQVYYCDDASLADYRAEPFAALVVKAGKRTGCRWPGFSNDDTWS